MNGIAFISADASVRSLLERFLSDMPYRVVAIEDIPNALPMLEEGKPVLVLLDAALPEEIRMPIQQSMRTREVQVLLFWAGQRQGGVVAELTVAGADTLERITSKESFQQVLAPYLPALPEAKPEPRRSAPEEIPAASSLPDFGRFRQDLLERLQTPPEKKDAILKLRPAQLYDIAVELGISEADVAERVAHFLGLPYIARVNYGQYQEGLLPKPFCRWNFVAPIITDAGETGFLISNPFDIAFTDVLRKHTPSGQGLKLILSEPASIRAILDGSARRAERKTSDGGEANVEMEAPPVVTTVIDDMEQVSEQELEQRPVVYVSNNVLYTAVVERASDIHIEPKEKETVVRMRIDGDMRDIFNLRRQTGTMVISRLKALAGLDIAERMKPQDGSVEAIINKRQFKLRLATTSTPNGESLIIRVLEPAAKPKPLSQLGMTDTQVQTMNDFSTRRYGLILVVGPTGAGKTTTIYSFLSNVDTKSRSLISVEDPVEYRIPNANQQQVNDKAGVTFEALLKSSVRQDPDILYLGEIRDNFSARISVDFASTGHMTISTLHTNNATTAIFRLERLGVTRDVMADALLGIIAQRLLKKLCPHCRRMAPLTPEEAELLAPFTDDLPAETAHPVGCPRCVNGYHGREGVYEVIGFDPVVADLIRNNAPILEIRQFIQKRGDYLISHHAVEKVKAGLFPVKDIHEKVLVEEVRATSTEQKAAAIRPSTREEEIAKVETILVVEDDLDNQNLIRRILENQGYAVTVAGDGIDALMQLGRSDFNLIISDINMPNLDGFKFLELKNQKGIKAPLIFLTSRADDEDEVKGLEMGALDYLRKPIKKDMLLLRVRKALDRSA